MANYTLTIGVGGGAASTDATVPGTGYNATAQIRCVAEPNKPMSSCKAGVKRTGNGSGTVHVTTPDGGSRVISFAAGRAVKSDSQAGMDVQRRGDISVVRIGTVEVYEIRMPSSSVADRNRTWAMSLDWSGQKRQADRTGLVSGACCVATVCRFVLRAFMLVFVVALFLFLVGTFGWFGSPQDPLAGVFLVPLGLPWNLLTDGVPDPFRIILAAAAPLLNLVILKVLCARFHPTGHS